MRRWWILILITVAAGLDHQKKTDKQKTDQDDRVRVLVGRAKGKGQHGPGRDHSPIGGRIQPCAPGIGSGQLATVKMHHRRGKVGGVQMIPPKGPRMVATVIVVV